MEDKVISEFKVVETEDGYRIEIKGDKEKIKAMLEHGPLGMRRRMMRHARHHGFGPFGRHHGPWGHGPWGPWGWWGDDEDEEEDEPEQAEKA